MQSTYLQLAICKDNISTSTYFPPYSACFEVIQIFSIQTHTLVCYLMMMFFISNNNLIILVSAAVIHVVSFIINPDPRLLASAPLLRCSAAPYGSPPPELASGDTAMVFPAIKPASRQLQLTAHSVQYLHYLQPTITKYTSKWNSKHNSNSTTGASPQSTSLIPSPRCRTASAGQLEIPQTPEEVSKNNILFAQRAASDRN